MTWLGTVALLATALTGIACADISTPAADIGSFGGSPLGLAGCWGVHSDSSQTEYCLVAFVMAGNSGGSAPVRLVAWGGSRMLDEQLPASVLQYGADQLGNVSATLDADTGDPDYGVIDVTVMQSEPRTTYDEVPSTAARVVEGVAGSTPVDSILPALYTSTPQATIAPSPCTEPISECLSWDAGTINNAPVFGVDNWLWDAGPASGGWNKTPDTPVGS